MWGVECDLMVGPVNPGVMLLELRDSKDNRAGMGEKWVKAELHNGSTQLDQGQFTHYETPI